MERFLAAVGACAAAAAAWAANPPASPPATAQLVARLGAAYYGDREAATRALEAAGPDAIPALEAAARDPNPEVSRRAVGVLAKFCRAADSKTYLVAKTVRLDYAALPLAAALTDLKARTGLPLALDLARVADPLRPVTCQTGDLPAWEAVAEFCRAAGLREVFATDLPVPPPDPQRRRAYYSPPPAPVADAVAVTLADGRYDPLPGSRSTAVRVLALPPSFTGHRVTLGTGDVTLCFDVTPTPGMNWHDVAGVKVTKVIDDAGRFGSAGVARDEAPPQNNYEGQQQVLMLGGGRNPFAMRWDNNGNPILPGSHANPRVVPVPLKLATPAARSLRLLEGVVVAGVVIPEQPLATVENPAGRVGVAVEGANGTTATVLTVDPAAGGRTTVRVRLESPSPWLAQRRRNPWGPLWPDQINPLAVGNQVRAFDAAGGPCAAAAHLTETSDNGATLATVVQLTVPGPAPAKLVVVGPTTIHVEVPFRMENVRLP